MTDKEAEAYKLCLLWQIIYKSLLPKEKCVLLTKDPRKSYLFKQCWKFIRETTIPKEDHTRYIYLQIKLLSAQTDGNIHAYIDPSCLNSRQSWERWKVGNRPKKITQSKNEFILDPKIVKHALERSKSFDKDDLTKQEIVKLVKLGKISYYYLLLSPKMREIFSGDDLGLIFGIDVLLFSSQITTEIKEWFEKENF